MARLHTQIEMTLLYGGHGNTPRAIPVRQSLRRINTDRANDLAYLSANGTGSKGLRFSPEGLPASLHFLPAVVLPRGIF